MNGKIKLSRDDYLDSLCRMCQHPNSPRICRVRRDGEYCGRVLEIARVVCKRTSLENLTVFEEG